LQDRNPDSEVLRVWAVRDGDVALTSPVSVPEPGTLALFGLGLGLFGMVGRRKSV
jgi:hypothetical protein